MKTFRFGLALAALVAFAGCGGDAEKKDCCKDGKAECCQKKDSCCDAGATSADCCKDGKAECCTKKEECCEKKHDDCCDGDECKPAPKDAATKAEAKLASKSGSKVTGKAEFTAKDGKVTVVISIEGASKGMHAVHIHEKSDCSDDAGKNCGGHWNPGACNHGKWGTAPFHLGDIGNIEVGEDGKGSITLTTDLWTIGGDAKTNVLGHSIVVHEKADDFTTQDPPGNAGARQAVGPIAESK